MKRMLDPYWSWALLTGSRYLLRDSSGRVRMMLAPRRGREMEDLKPPLALIPTRSTALEKYCSAWIKTPSLEILEKLMESADFVLTQPGMRPIGEAHGEGIEPLGPVGAAMPVAEQVVIGVIDGRCGFANEKFCLPPDGGIHSRIGYFWDQSEAPSGSWQEPHGFAYGRELDRKMLDALLAKGVSGDAVRRHGTRAEAEKVLYRTLGHDLPFDADWSHGTHVLDTVLADFDATAKGANTYRKSPGVVYVQVPDAALRDTSGRWAASYVLDALHYILSRAGDRAHVIVNISLGSFAGPHDGSSLLERAIDELVKEHANRLTVVVAAGNAGRVVDDGTGQPKPCHARVTLDAAGGASCDEPRRSVDLQWVVDVADTTESFMEIWIPKLEADGEHACVEVSLGPVNSAGKSIGASCVAQPGEHAKLVAGGEVCAALINATGNVEVPNGSGGMVLVALGHTSGPGGSCAPSATWIVRITNKSPFPITFDAWVERRDIPGELTGFRPQYGFRPTSSGLTNKGSLGTLANGKYTIVVGAANLDEKSRAYQASEYSSVGMTAIVGDCNARPVARSGPDLYGIGKRKATGFLSGSSKILSGTSMAAAQVTAAVASVAVSGAKDASLKGRKGLLDLLSREAERRQSPGEPKAPGPDGSGAPRLPDVDGRLSEHVLPEPKALKQER